MRKTTGLILSSVLLVSAFAAAPAQAQLTCSDIDFTGLDRTRFPDPEAACLDVVERNGELYAKFSAEIQRVSGSSVYAKFLMPDGSKTDTYRFNPPATARVKIGERTYRYRDLGARQKINVYLPEGRWEVHVAETEDDFATAAAVAATTPMWEESEPEGEPVAMLPSTASPIPLLGMLGGLLTGLGALFYGIRRRL